MSDRSGESPPAADWSVLNARMVERMKSTGAVRSPEIAEAFLETPRHLFLPGIGHDLVYSGQALITRVDPDRGPTSSSSEVFIMGPMLEALAIERGHRVLEVGAGTGYNAAILDRLVGTDGEVVSVDVQPDVADEARQHLVVTGHSRVRIVAADGYRGHPERAPYDRVIATASVRDIPVAWRDQLRDGGRLVVPMRFASGSQMIVAFIRRGDVLESVRVVSGGFMPLRTAHESLEEPIELGDNWEATTATPRKGDGELITTLLRDEPTMEAVRAVPWQVSFTVMGLLETDWIVVRQKGRSAMWWGLLDRDARGLALLWPTPMPLAEVRSILFCYGSDRSRDRLVSRLEELADAKVERLRVRARPPDGERSPTADVTFACDNFVYEINWHAAVSTAVEGPVRR